MKTVKFLLPILVYFVASWLWTPVVALAASVAISAVLFGAEYIIRRRVDKSQLCDIALLIVLGAVEIGFESSEEMMWIAVPLIVAALLFVSLRTDVDLLGGGLFERMLRSPFNRYNFQACQRRMIAWCLFLAIVSLAIHLYPEEELAQTARGYMLLTTLLGYVATEIVARRLMRRRWRGVEWVPLVDEEAKVLGVAPRPLVHNGSHWLHPVVHLHVFHRGRLLLQLRPLTKKIQPGKWDTAVGGHIGAGEKLQEALKREVWEEIGLENFEAKLMHRYIWRSAVEHEYVFSFRAEHPGPFEPKNEGEVAELKFWSRTEIEVAMGKGIFTPNLEAELKQWLLADELFR